MIIISLVVIFSVAPFLTDFGYYAARDRDQQRRSDIHSLSSSAKYYFKDEKRFPDKKTLVTIFSEDYLRSPIDPLNDKPGCSVSNYQPNLLNNDYSDGDYGYYYEEYLNSSGKDFLIAVCLESSKRLGNDLDEVPQEAEIATCKDPVYCKTASSDRKFNENYLQIPSVVWEKTKKCRDMYDRRKQTKCCAKVGKELKSESVCKVCGGNKCYLELALVKEKPSLCQNTILSGMRAYCYLELAKLKKEPELCRTIDDRGLDDKLLKKECYEKLKEMNVITEKEIPEEVGEFEKVSGAPYIGLKYNVAERKEELPLGYGHTVTGVIPGSPADKAGLVEGDIVLEFGGRKITSDNSLYDITHDYEEYKPGQEVILRILRGDEIKEVKIILGRPAWMVNPETERLKYE